MLVVPYPRRKRVEVVLRGARIEVEWIKAPTPEDISRSDHDRLLALCSSRPRSRRRIASSPAG